MGRGKDKKKIIIIRNVNPSAGKLFAQFVFGDGFVSFGVNSEDETFEIQVTRDIPIESIEDFVDFWGERWVIFYRNAPVLEEQ